MPISYTYSGDQDEHDDWLREFKQSIAEAIEWQATGKGDEIEAKGSKTVRLTIEDDGGFIPTYLLDFEYEVEIDGRILFAPWAATLSHLLLEPGKPPAVGRYVATYEMDYDF